jgi:hypothetical protein
VDALVRLGELLAQLLHGLELLGLRLQLRVGLLQLRVRLLQLRVALLQLRLRALHPLLGLGDARLAHARALKRVHELLLELLQLLLGGVCADFFFAPCS